MNMFNFNFFIDKPKSIRYKFAHSADIAQLVELLICNQWVGSSSLSVGTIKKPPNGGFFVYKEQLKLELPTQWVGTRIKIAKSNWRFLPQITLLLVKKQATATLLNVTTAVTEVSWCCLQHLRTRTSLSVSTIKKTTFAACFYTDIKILQIFTLCIFDINLTCKYKLYSLFYCSKEKTSCQNISLKF